MSDPIEQRRILDVDGVPTSVIEVGEGEPVLCIHGSGPAISSWFSFRLDPMTAPTMLGGTGASQSVAPGRTSPGLGYGCCVSGPVGGLTGT